MKLTTLFGTFQDSAVEKSIVKFVLLPKENEGGFSEGKMVELIRYCVDRLWYSGVSLEEARSYMNEAVIYTDLYKDDLDRKDRISDIVEERYAANERNPPELMDTALDLDEKDPRRIIASQSFVNSQDRPGAEMIGFGYITAPYDIQCNLMEIVVPVETEGIQGKGAWYRTSVIYRYDQKVRQARIYTLREGEKRNENYDPTSKDEKKRQEYILYSTPYQKIYIGNIRFIGVARRLQSSGTEEEDVVYYSINRTRYMEPLAEARDRIVSTVNARNAGQMIFIILSHLMKMNDRLKYDFVEPGFYINETVRIKYRESWPKRESIPSILQKLNEFYSITTNPNAFKIKLYFELLGPFSYRIRQNGRLFPILFLHGETRGGKTSMASFFTDVGWDNPGANLTEKNMETKYTSLRNLSKKQASTLIDEVGTTFLMPLQHFLNSASTTVGSASRGGKGADKRDLWEYEVKVWITMTSNSPVNLGKAFQNRLVVVNYDDASVRRQNLFEYERKKGEFPRGFMYALFEEIFGGQKVDDILMSMVSGVEKEEMLVAKMFSFIEDRLKEVYRAHGVRWEMDGELKWERGFRSDYLVEIFQYFKQAAEWVDQMAFKTIDSRTGEPKPMDKFDKYGFNVDFFQISRDPETYFVTPKAYKMFCRDSNMPLDLRSIDSIEEFVGKRDYLKVTSRRVSGNFPMKGLRVVQPPLELMGQVEEMKT